ncbi:MAG: type IV pilin protein [Nitrospiraceae bacterium]
MKRLIQRAGRQGFTLIEVMVVLAILAILIVIAGVSYRASIEKAKAVEAEIALHEVNRLENLYHQTHSQYSSDLKAIGYAPSPPLKYYALEVELKAGAGGIAYRATAKPTGSQPTESWALTRYQDGTTVLEKEAPSTTGSTSAGGSSPDSGSGPDSVADTNPVTGKNKSTSGEVTHIVPLTKNTDPMITGGSATSGDD